MTSCQSTHRRTVEDDIIALNQISNVEQKIEMVGVEPQKIRNEESVTKMDTRVFFLHRIFSVNHVQFIATYAW
jgi:hypothetical protein